MDIQFKNVNQKFGVKWVLRDFSCTFPEGKITCVMGPSGCGKTTILSLMAGLLRPDSGKITGVPSKIAVVFQEDRLLNGFSALTNAALANPERKEEARALLLRLGISEKDSRAPVGSLSGGMQRRVAIARALVFDGDLLLLDEGFKGLDAETKSEVMRTVREYAKGKTVVSVTHDEAEAEEFADSVLRLTPLVVQAV